MFRSAIRIVFVVWATLVVGQSQGMAAALEIVEEIPSEGTNSLFRESIPYKEGESISPLNDENKSCRENSDCEEGSTCALTNIGFLGLGRSKTCLKKGRFVCRFPVHTSCETTSSTDGDGITRKHCSPATITLESDGAEVKGCGVTSAAAYCALDDKDVCVPTNGVFWTPSWAFPK